MLLNDLKQDIIGKLNNSNLPIDAIYYVMREVLLEVETTYNEVLQQETKARLKEVAEVDNKEINKFFEEQQNQKIEEKEEE